MEPLITYFAAEWLYNFLILASLWSVVSLIVTSITKKPFSYDSLHINPLLVAGAIQAGTGIIGLLRKPPDVPDVFTPALRQATRARSRVFEQLGDRRDELEANLRARGATGSGGSSDREALIRAASSTVADIDASIADLITNAGNQQRRLEFEDRSQRFASSQQALSSLGNAATSIFALSQLQGAEAGGESIGFNSPELGFTPSGPTPTSAPVNPLEVGIRGGRSLPSLSPVIDPVTGTIVFGG